MADCVHQTDPVAALSITDVVAALATLGVRLPVQTHADDNCTIADADGGEVCVIDQNSQREDAAAFEITELLIHLINAAVAPVAEKAPAAIDISPVEVLALKKLALINGALATSLSDARARAEQTALLRVLMEVVARADVADHAIGGGRG